MVGRQAPSQLPSMSASAASAADADDAVAATSMPNPLPPTPPSLLISSLLFVGATVEKRESVVCESFSLPPSHTS